MAFPASTFDVVSNPEFLREGSAAADFLHPDRIVIGCNNDRSAALISEVYPPLTSGAYYERPDRIPGQCVPDKPPVLLRTSPQSAELIKHASNAFLAMKVSFINAIANLCEIVGANITEVAPGIGTDQRIGTQFLHPGIGYGGSCFPKDLTAFRSMAAEYGIDFSLLGAIERINELQPLRFLEKVRNALGSLEGKHLAVLGLAYKGGTDDVRESPAMRLVQLILAEGATHRRLRSRRNGARPGGAAAQPRPALCGQRTGYGHRSRCAAGADRLAAVSVAGSGSFFENAAAAPADRWPQLVRAGRCRSPGNDVSQRRTSRRRGNGVRRPAGTFECDETGASVRGAARRKDSAPYLVPPVARGRRRCACC